MEQYKQEFIEFMVDCNVLRFGEFTLKSGRKSPFFMNAGLYVTGAQLEKLGVGDVKVKKFLVNVMQSILGPMRERRAYWEARLPEVYEMLKKGSEIAERKAAETLADVRAAMKINYFDDGNLMKK